MIIVILLLLLLTPTFGNAAASKWIPTMSQSYTQVGCDNSVTYSTSYVQAIAQFDLNWNAFYNEQCYASGGLNSWQRFKSFNPNQKIIIYRDGPTLYDFQASSNYVGIGFQTPAQLQSTNGIGTGDNYFAVGKNFSDYLVGKLDGGGYENTMFMNVASAGWRTYYATHVLNYHGITNPFYGGTITLTGVDGVIADNTFNSYLPNSGPRKWDHPTEPAFDDCLLGLAEWSVCGSASNMAPWTAGSMATISAVTGLLNASSKIFVPNYDAYSIPAEHPLLFSTWAALDALTNPPYAAMHECNLRCPWSAFSGDSSAATIQAMADLQAQMVNTKVIMNEEVGLNCNTGSVLDADPSIALKSCMSSNTQFGRPGWTDLWFSMMSFMLGYDKTKQSAGIFSFGISNNVINRPTPVYYDEFDPAFLHLGNATAAYTRTGDLFYRPFDDGCVVVNGGTALTGVAVPAACSGGGQVRVVDHNNLANPNSASLVSSFDIGNKIGVILLRNGRSITNSDNPDTPFPAWVAGKYGNGLQFTGTQTLVIPDANSLDVSVRTIEAWVNPSEALTGFKSIYSEDPNSGSYFTLFASSESYWCGFTGASAGFSDFTSDFPVCDPTGNLPVSTWTHLAVTYDGMMIRLYKNGTEVASRAATFLPRESSSVRYIGNSFFGEGFKGIIDEFQEFNYARTQAQIQLDMVTPLP